jgi:hypothetical protein
VPGPSRRFEPPPPAVEDLHTLLERARAGDPGAAPLVRRVLDEHPEVWQHCGDLARQAERAWVELAGGPDELLKQSLELKLAALKTELAGPFATPLERLLVERVGMTWLQLAYADAIAAQARDVSVRQAAFLQKRQDAAQRRHLAAVGALAAVRRLLPAAGSGAAVAPSGALPQPPAEGGPAVVYQLFDGRGGSDARHA